MKTYTCYKVLLTCPRCEKQTEVASFDYYRNAIWRRNQLIETFGKYRVKILKKTRKFVDKNNTVIEIN